MSNKKFTQNEIDALLKMLKKSLADEIFIPQNGDSKEFQVQGDDKKSIFNVHVYRGRRAANKYNIGARIEKNNFLLLELHINPSNVHINPDGTKIIGSHWHIYSEKYGRREAFPAADLTSDDFVECTISFLTKFNVVEQPSIKYQIEMN